jgi:lysyl oxidase
VTRRTATLAAGLLVLAAVCVAALAGGGTRARAAGPADLLPDLVADPPAHPLLDYYSYSDGSHDLLLRFDGYVDNVGAGALDIRASRTDPSQPMPPLQRVYRTDNSYHDDPMPAKTQLLYSNADGHHHWHLQSIAAYSLSTSDRKEQIAPAQKVGFCLDDSQYMGSANPPPEAVYDDAHGRHFCQKNHPDALSLFEGVSAGWRDVYERWLALQWVVASDVQPGAYRLREDMDPTGVIHESNEVNPPAWSVDPVTIPGYVARAFAAPRTRAGRPETLMLRSSAYGSPGPRWFRIVTPPRHGKLNVAAGAFITGDSVKYTPAHRYHGLDRFTYAAVDYTSPYPRHPGTATVALAVGVHMGPRVMIEGAPTAVQAGTGVQLHARVSHARGHRKVSWSVDGVPRGNARVGKITSTGFYVAPSTAPHSGRVIIAARNADGANDRRFVKIVWSAPPGASPGTAAAGGSRKLVASTEPAPRGRLLAATVMPRHAGEMSIRARVGRRRLGSCRARTPRRSHFTCRLYLPDGLQIRDLRIVAEVVRHHVVVDRWRRAGAP